MPEERTWSEAMPGVGDSFDAREAMTDMVVMVPLHVIEEVAALAARLARERAEKRAGEIQQTELEKLRNHVEELVGSGAEKRAAEQAGTIMSAGGACVCLGCREKDSEIAKLKENLAAECDLKEKLEYQTCMVKARDQYAEIQTAEIAKLKEQLASEARQVEMVRAIHSASESKLAAAQAKAIQPADIVFRPDGEPRVPDNDWCVYSSEGAVGKHLGGKVRQCYKRVQ